MDKTDPIKNTINNKRGPDKMNTPREKQNCLIQDTSLEGKLSTQQYVPASNAENSEAGPSDILTNKERYGRENIIDDDINLPYNDLKTLSNLIDESTPAPSHGSIKGKSTPYTMSNAIHDRSNSMPRNNDKVKKKLPQAIQELLNDKSDNIDQANINFEATPEAAHHNWELLKKYDFNLERICNYTKKRSLASYGSEFKSPKKLEKLLDKHPRWEKLKKILMQGVNFDLEGMSEEMRKADLEAAYKRGNHKSAAKNKEFLSKALIKEIEQGWIMVLPEYCYKEIPGLVLNPMGVVTHLGVTDTGEFVPKNRVTHDLSFPGLTSQSSLNSRVPMSSLEPCMFAHVFLRIIHYIIAVHKKYPNTRI